jgi:AcrR family transcriptional regulator
MRAQHAPLSKQPRRRGRPKHDSADTREALLDAAEKVFAAFGVEGASMRSISATAGLTHAAVNYHYPSRDSLLDAVLGRRGEGIARRFDELLAQLEATGRKPSADELIEAIATPHMELMRDNPVGGRRWLRIEARLMLGQDPHLIEARYLPAGMRARIWRLIHRGFPTVPEPLLRTSWYICVATLLQMLGNSDVRFAWAARGATPHAMQTYIDILTRFAASGFAAVMADAAGTGRPPKQARS